MPILRHSVAIILRLLHGHTKQSDIVRPYVYVEDYI